MTSGRRAAPAAPEPPGYPAFSTAIARAHGGEVTASNAPGGGAVFTLEVPAGGASRESDVGNA